jgi:hypothetical protein
MFETDPAGFVKVDCWEKDSGIRALIPESFSQQSTLTKPAGSVSNIRGF